MKFLDKLAEEIAKTHRGEYSRLAVILPSQRAGLFFKKAMAKLSSRPVWAPKIFTLDDFAGKLTGFQPADSLTLVFKLYTLYRQQFASENVLFEDFIEKANVFLRDFNDIDMAMADVDNLYRNMADYLAIEQWDPADGGERLSHKFLKVWEEIPVLIRKFKEQLIREQIAYKGMMYRHAVEKLRAGEADIKAEALFYDHIYIAGFNALTHAEYALLEEFKKLGNATVYWSAEKFSLEDNLQESGKFLRTYQKSDGANFKWISNYIGETEKNISIAGVNGEVAIARLAGQRLEKMIAGGARPEETAIVLADENLLIPLLESLPESLKHFNVTLGFPLSGTSWMNYIEKILSLHLNKERFANKKQVDFYYKDILTVLTHPAIHLNREVSDELMMLAANIQKSKRIMWSSDEIGLQIANGQLSETLQFVFTDWKGNGAVALQAIHSLLNSVLNGNRHDALMTEQLNQLMSVTITLQQAFEKAGFAISINALNRLFRTVVGQKKVPYIGEPLAGVQIMGLLETRLLSFKNVLLLSATEGVIPSAGSFNTYLPFAIRKAFKIRTNKDTDAIFSYHFTHLLSASENAHLFYNTSANAITANEKSRFVRQLQREWPAYNERIHVEEKMAIAASGESLVFSERIRKTPEVIENIRKYLINRGLSPSALINYIESPLDFYYSNVLMINSPDGSLEDMEHNTFGTIVHDVLERVYFPGYDALKPKEPMKPYLLTADYLEQRLKKIDRLFDAVLIKNNISKEPGKHILSIIAAKKYVNRFVKGEINQLRKSPDKVLIEGVEIFERSEIQVGEYTFKVKGKMDRVETRNGVQYIIDYKTGTVLDNDVKVNNLQDIDQDLRKSKFVQLLFYAWVMQKNNPVKSIVSGIYSLKNSTPKLQSAEVNKQEILTEKTLSRFENFVRKKMEEMMDEQIELVANPSYEYGVFS